MLSYIISLTFSVLHHFLYLQVIIQPLTVRYIISEMYFSVLQLSLLLQYDVIIYSRYIGNMESVNNTFNISSFYTYNHYNIVEVHYDVIIYSQHRGNLLSSNMTPNVCKQIHTLSHIHTHTHAQFLIRNLKTCMRHHHFSYYEIDLRKISLDN